ncbi:hypothetical protein ACIQVR_28930 [Streptomyces xanthochromogenes]|uniref:hypothetical protein n=1 Tax=Streptomyces xanthochromogenes TaxID=67384 RepID=UPI003801AEB3
MKSLTAYGFMGFVCAHRITVGAVVLDADEWSIVNEVLDERLHKGAPIVTLSTQPLDSPDGPEHFLHARPGDSLLICADEPPQHCGEHATPRPFTPSADSPASGGTR